MSYRKRILIDFDGTLSSYKTPFNWEKPWELPDPPIPGAIAFVTRLQKSEHYEPVIFTTRALAADGGVDTRVSRAINDWLHSYGMERGFTIEVTVTKLTCALIIDDNCFRFEGRYPTPEQLAKLTERKRRPK